MENIWQIIMLIIVLEIIKTIKNNRPGQGVRLFF